MERLDFDLLFRWFVGLGMDDAVWDHSTFYKNRDRLLEGEIAAKFLTALLDRPEVKRLLSSEQFSVDGTLIEAWASIKSFRRKDGGDQDNDGPGRNAERSFHKEKRSNETHQSTTDPEARLYKKGEGQPAKLCYMAHTLMEKRNGLAVLGGVSHATGTAERDQVLKSRRSHAPDHGRCRQGLRRHRFCWRAEQPFGDAAHRHRRAFEQDRQAT